MTKFRTAIIADWTLSAASAPGIDAQIPGWMAALQANGSFADIDYGSTNIAFWPPINHTIRVRDLARAYLSPASSFFSSASVLNDALHALDYWLLTPSQNSNWWFQQIGIPGVIGPAGVLLTPYLLANQSAAVSVIMSKSNTGPGTDANAVWEASNMLYAGVIASDTQTLCDAIDVLWGAVTVVSGAADGIRSDYSFWMHGAQLYSGGYGMCAAVQLMKTITYAAGTSIAAPSSVLSLFERWLLRGSFQMMAFGQGRPPFGPAMWDVSTIGRDIARPYGSDDVYGAAGQAVQITSQMIEQYAVAVNGTYTAQVRAFAPFFNGTAEPAARSLVVGSRNYPQSDYYVHTRPGFMASVRMVSTRTLSCEGINSENELGVHLSDGAIYLYQSGYEYANVFPAWDWQRVPGTTVKQNVGGTALGVPGLTSFVGGASDGTHGIVALDWVALNQQGLVMRRSVIFLEDSYVVLAANITDTVAGSTATVTTSIEQRISSTDVYTSDNPATPLPANVTQALSATAWWVWEGNVGYVFPYRVNASLPGAAASVNSTIFVSTQQQNGTWQHIGQQTGYVSFPIFGLWLQHASPVIAQTFAYVVVPNISLQAFTAGAARLSMLARIVQNSADAQVVYRDDIGLLAAAAFTPPASPLASISGFQLNVSSAGTYLLSATSSNITLTAALPTHSTWSLSFTLDRALVPSSGSNVSCTATGGAMLAPPDDGTSQALSCGLASS